MYWYGGQDLKVIKSDDDATLCCVVMSRKVYVKMLVAGGGNSALEDEGLERAVFVSRCR